MGTGLRLNLEVAQERVLKLKGLLIKQMLRHSCNLSKMKAFHMFNKKLKDSRSEDTEVLQEQITTL
jgi:hypothetical protein